MLREQILDLSKRYIKALAEENRNVVDGPYAGVMTAYGKFCTAGAPPSNSALPPRDPRGSHTWSWIDKLKTAQAFPNMVKQTLIHHSHGLLLRGTRK